MKKTLFAAVLAIAPVTATAQDAVARMAGPDGTEMGEVRITRAEGGVLIQLALSGIPEGPHGFHIHETGACSPDFGAAGDHYNPGGVEHGLTNPAGHHAGDTPNIVAAADGTASADIYWTAVSLDEGAEAALFDADGSAFIVHENPDSYAADAGAGGRIACGVIEAM